MVITVTQKHVFLTKTYVKRIEIESLKIGIVSSESNSIGIVLNLTMPILAARLYVNV